MAGASFPEAVFLRRSDGSGYGFFFYGDADYQHAVASFSVPVLRTFSGEPIPGQPDPQDHLKTAIATFIGEAFDRTVPGDIGPEGVSRAVAAAVHISFTKAIPRIVMIERKEGRLIVRPGVEFLQHPGFPLAIVVDADAHGGEAHFFSSEEEYQKASENSPNAHCWLPQIVFRLYRTTPSVMAGRPMVDHTSGKASIECRGLFFGRKASLKERSLK